MLQLSFRYQSSDEEMGGRSVEEYIKTKLYNFWNNEYSWKLVPIHQIEQIAGPKDSSDDLSTAISWLSTGLTMVEHNVYFDMAE